MTKFGQVVLVILGSLVCLAWMGHVLMVLWGWFIVPTFPIAPLTFKSAVGVTLVANLLHLRYDHSTATATPDEANERLVGALCFLLIAPTVTLFFGWVFHTWM